MGRVCCEWATRGSVCHAQWPCYFAARGVLSVYLSAAYLRNHMTKLNQIFVHVGHSSVNFWWRFNMKLWIQARG